MNFGAWRILHRSGTAVVGLLSIAHIGLTPMIYDGWTPEAVWFVGTGVGLLLLAVVNWAHVGLEPCRQPTAPAVRYANVVYLVFGVAAVIAVPEFQAYVLFAGLFIQAMAGQVTLRRPQHVSAGEG